MDKKDYHRQKSREWYKRNKSKQIANVRKNTKQLAERNRAFVLGYLQSHPCVDCGEPDLVVLEFDHIRDKSRNISSLIFNAWSLETIQNEITKCEVVCCNCHRRRTASRASWFKAI